MNRIKPVASWNAQPVEAKPLYKNDLVHTSVAAPELAQPMRKKVTADCDALAMSYAALALQAGEISSEQYEHAFHNTISIGEIK